MLNSTTKHILHCCLLLVGILVFEFVSGGLRWNTDKQEEIDPWIRYGIIGTITLYLLRTVTFLSLPQVLFNFVGLTIYNAFPDKVILKGSPLLAPFICIRIVTRGDYPELVKTNVKRNLNKCIEAGLENFQIEVVSDKPIGLTPHRRVREVVVPPNYRTSSGALFKARALQYCLESSANELADHDWIVHLDEETLMTENSVRGVLNFVLDGKHQFGQGLITYANEDVVNWITTLADSFRVADDMGKLRLQFTMFHKPFFSMKGSYVVTQMGAEKQVSFNNGLDGSVAEDCFFAMKAFSQGYTFNFVDGEMWEKSPFSLWDFVQQRKRWLQVIQLFKTMSSEMCKKDVLQAVILADDFTTSLTPLQNIYPSILMPVINIPLFNYMIETLMRSKIQEVFLYCSSHIDLLKKYVKEMDCKDITISLIISDGCRSLGDALRDIDTKGWIRGYFILIRGNTFINTNLRTLLNTHRLKVDKDKGAAMTMVLRNFGSTKDSSLNKETTMIVSDKSSNKLLHYTKLKNKETKVKLELNWFLDHNEVEVDTCYLDTHIYLCSPSVLPLFADNFDFQTMDDFVRGVLMNEEILDSRIYWRELNTEDYALPITSWKAYHTLTQDILRRHSFPLVPDGFALPKEFICMPWSTYKHKTATLAKGCVLEKDCILGHNSTLGNNTRVKRSMIADNCIAGSNVNICDSYIFSNVRIRDNCTIKNSILFPNCIIKYGSQIDGCILCPGIEVASHSQYVDIVVENVSSNIFKTKMSDLDVNEDFLYFKNVEVTECDNDSTESSSSEENCNSPIPDDTNMFLSEVIDSLLRGYQDKLNCDNLILEINSSRYAYNVTIREVTYNVIKAILSLPLHYLSETKTPVNNQNYQKNLKVMITYFNTIILNYVKNEDAQNDCLRAIEDVASTTDELLPYTQHLLHQFYDRDILSEEKILEWYEFAGEDVDVLHNKIRNAVQPFIKWLREAEEDSESDDD